MKKITSILLIAAAVAIGFTACVKKDFDEPPFGGDFDPNLGVNMNIADLKDLHQSFDPTAVTEDFIISGIVTANDESGNFYKQIIIQDTSGAVGINIDKTGLHNEYPIGRKVYVRCKGLVIGDYGGFKQIGYGEEADGIPTILKDDFVVKASFPHVVEPLIVTPGQLQNPDANEKLVGTLIKFDEVEFNSRYLSGTFAETPSAGSGSNRALQECNGDTIILRTSNYAAFQAQPIPQGRGSLVGIYSRFNSTAQVLIRDLTDVDMNMERCPFGTPNDTLMRIGDLRNLYNGSAVVIKDSKIRGVVISDPSDDFGNNITSKNMVLQDGDRGIVVRFAASEDNNWAMGDSLEIIISNQTLSEFGRLLQIGDQVTANKVQKLGVGTITPRVATIQEIITNFEDWESTLVTINNATVVSGSGSTYQGTLDLNDGSTSTDFPHFTQYYAEFANVPAPIGQVKSVTGFLYSITSADRISIRRLTDVSP